jgi:hypothetical protein
MVFMLSWMPEVVSKIYHVLLSLNHLAKQRSSGKRKAEKSSGEVIVLALFRTRVCSRLEVAALI